MDKQKVIEAYRRGLITLIECGQILGADQSQVDGLLSDQGLRLLRTEKPFTMFDQQ
jgi:hypothetical protein